MRAHLILNPEARAVTPALRRLIRAALEARFKLEATHTSGRDSAIHAARAAAEGGSELLVAFGGDGLVNDVINGIVGTDTVLAVIPGGTMNVLARKLGIPRSPLEAADRLLRSVEEVEPRVLRLGLANDRYFGFACGCGFDAEVAARVESNRDRKRRFGEAYFYGAAVGTLLRAYASRRPYLRCEGTFGSEQAVLAIATMPGPYAFLAGRPVRLVRGTPLEGRLQLFLLRRMGVAGLPAYVSGVLTGHFGPHARSFPALEELTVRAEEPFPYHLDGESMTPVARLTIRAADEFVRILA